MHSSLMLRTGARPEVTRDNMGHANIDLTQNVYGRSWWEERVEAVTRTVEAIFPAGLESPDLGQPLNVYELRHPLRIVPETWFTLSALFDEAGGRDAMEGAFRYGCLRFIHEKNGRGERIRTSDPLVPNQQPMY